MPTSDMHLIGLSFFIWQNKYNRFWYVLMQADGKLNNELYHHLSTETFNTYISCDKHGDGNSGLMLAMSGT